MKTPVLLFSVIVATTVRCLVTAFLLFGAAGTINWPEGRLLILGLCALSGVIQIILIGQNPALILERIRPGPGKPATDRVISFVLSILFNIWLVVMALDAVRFGWSSIPAWMKPFGVASIITAQTILYTAQQVNAFASSVVRIQPERGQAVVSAGPYRFIRHPNVCR